MANFEPGTKVKLNSPLPGQDLDQRSLAKVVEFLDSPADAEDQYVVTVTQGYGKGESYQFGAGNLTAA